jgi:hypothetical protein
MVFDLSLSKTAASRSLHPAGYRASAIRLDLAWDAHDQSNDARLHTC